MKPFEKAVLIVFFGLLVCSFVLKRVLPERVWFPIETGAHLIVASIAAGTAPTNIHVNVTDNQSSPPPTSRNLRNPYYHYNDPHSHHRSNSTPTLTPTPTPKRPRFTQRQKKNIANSQHWRCGICDDYLPLDCGMFDIDHIKRWSDTYDNSSSNLQAVHVTCHRRKTRWENSKH